jgi:tetratricopeptide (TPR) repeat protein
MASVHDPARESVGVMTQRVQSLFDCFVLVEDVIQRLESDTTLHEEARAVAIRLARIHEDDPWQLNKLSWSVVKLPDEEPQAYERAVRFAEAACKVKPESGHYLSTLGVAQYRLGEYEEALATLAHSDEFNGGKQPADVAFLAMANQRLGRIEEARAGLARLRVLMQDADLAADEDARNFLAEAEALIGD